MTTQSKFFVIPKRNQIVCFAEARLTVQFDQDGNGQVVEGLDLLSAKVNNDAVRVATLMRECGDAFARPVWELTTPIKNLLYRGCGRGWIRIDATVPEIIDMAYADDFESRDKNQNVWCTDHNGYVVDDETGEIIARTPPPGTVNGDKVYVNFSAGEAIGFGI